MIHIHMLISSRVNNVHVDMKTQGSASTPHIGIHVSTSLERNSILFLHGLIICSQILKEMAPALLNTYLHFHGMRAVNKTRGGVLKLFLNKLKINNL